MVLSHETVNAYKELLTNPQKHGLQFKPLHECFEEIEYEVRQANNSILGRKQEW